MDMGEMKRKGATLVAFYKGNGEQVDYFSVDELAAAIAAAVAEERERCAAYMNGRADAIERDAPTVIGMAIASIFRDEATAIRKG